MQRLTFNLGHTFCAELTEQVLHVFKLCNVMFGIFAFSLAYFLKHWLWNWNFDTCYVSIYSLSYILASNMTYDICILWNYYYSQSNQHLHWLILCVVITFSLPIRLIYYMWLPGVTGLYMSCLDLICLVFLKLCSLWPPLPHFSTSSVLENHYFILWSYDLNLFLTGSPMLPKW